MTTLTRRINEDVVQTMLEYLDWNYLYGLGVIILIFTSIFWLHSHRTGSHEKKDPGKSAEIQVPEAPPFGTGNSDFLAAVAHEIRNPMNGIVGIAESIKIDGLDSDGRHKLKLLRHCAGHLASLLDDFLGDAQNQPNAFKLDSEPFEVSALIESIAALTAFESERCGIPVEIAISPAVPRLLTGDPRRIRQILLNYVFNALKSSRSGVVSVTVWRNQSLPGSAEIFFAVSDDGPGVPLDDQKKLFSRFDRNINPPAGEQTGMGLGLFISKTLAEKMKGRVWFKSEPGKGACFYFGATFAVPSNDQQSPAFPAVPLPSSVRHALVIDDAEYNRVALTGMLESLGLNVKTAADPHEFLSLAASENFDVIFVDYAVAGLDGPEIAKQIRALPGASNRATIFATTAYNSAEKRAACMTAGMDAFLTKPITLDRLRRALRAGTARESSPDLRPIPRDPLTNLRILAARKGALFVDELSTYFLDFEAELTKLTDALQKEDSGRASYFAHLLYGRCSFINERELERTLRTLESIAAMERWEDARKLGHEVQLRMETLRVKLVADNPIAPLA